MTARRRLTLYLLLVAAVLLAAPGCGDWSGMSGNGNENGNEGEGEPEEENGAVGALERFANRSGEGFFYRTEDPPPEIAAWVDDAAANLFLGQSRVHGDYLYILVTYGPKPTGGYAAAVTGVHEGPEAITVVVDFKKPAPGETVTQAFTYPYDLVLVPASALPVIFEARGDEEYVMTLYGIETLEPVVAASDWIKLFEPAPGAAADGHLRFGGVASVFEGQVNYRLTGPDGAVLAEGYTMAGMGDWYYFAGEISLAPLLPAGDGPVAGRLELFTISPRDGSETDKVSVELTLRP